MIKSKYRRRKPYRIALNIYANGKSRNMCGTFPDMYGERGSIAAEPLRTYAERIEFELYFAFEFCEHRVFAGFAYLS